MPRYKKTPSKASKLEETTRKTEPQKSNLSNATSKESDLKNSNSNANENISINKSTFSETATTSQATNRKKAELEVGTIDLRLHVPGLIDLIIPVPRPETTTSWAYLNKIFDEFKDKHWCKLNEWERPYKCLLCEDRFVHLSSIQSHLAKHMGFPIARCTRCSKKFYHLSSGRVHIKNCKD